MCDSAQACCDAYNRHMTSHMRVIMSRNALVPPGRLTIAIFIALLIVMPLYAEPEPDPGTLDALAEAVIPPRDRIDLAQRLLGLETVPPPPQSVRERQPGERQTFWATNLFENRPFRVPAVLRATGKHIYLWVQEDVDIPTQTLETLVEAFDNRIYPGARALWGAEDKPGVDGDPRVYGLFAYGMGPSVAAYFASEHTQPVAAVATSNQHEMFFFNLDTLGTMFSAAYVAGIVGHEFQHMIRENQDPNEDTWLDEGFSMFTEIYLGYSDGVGAALSFLALPGTQLNTWAEDSPRLPHYGAAQLFVTYFYERFGEDALRQLSTDPANGLHSVQQTLAAVGGPDVDALFADWVLANGVMDASVDDGRYGYRLLPGLPGPAATQVVTQYPLERTVTSASQYATHYMTLTNLDEVAALDIRIDLPATVGLVPTDAASGAYMWYSNRADDSDTTLTRAFDLTDVDTATLEYSVWYHTEHLWDYGYVMVSDDDGATWTPLETPHTTYENPHNNAYGPGYTGSSDGWIAERLSLDAFAGREILVRFEVITDDAVNQPGMVIDDMRIAEIGYSSDFERDGGGWTAEGWVWIDNELPQQAWVQAVQRTGEGVVVSRWLAPDESNWTLTLEPGVGEVLLAVSPFAPLTTVPTSYTLRVTPR